MTYRRINKAATDGNFGPGAKFHSVRLLRMLSVATAIATIACRDAAGQISPGDIDTYTYAWYLPNQTGETAAGMQWLLKSFSISNIESVFENGNTYPDSYLTYTDPMFDNRVIWTGASTPQGGQALFGIETTSELESFTGNWLDESEKIPLAPTFEFSPPDWDYVPGHEEYVVRMGSPKDHQYWVQRRLSYLQSPIELDRAGAFDKLYDQAQLIDTSPRPLPPNAEELELRMPAQQGVVGFLLAYDLFADEGALPGRSLGRYVSAASLTGVNPDPEVTGDFDGDGDVDGRDFLVWQRGASPNPSSGRDLADWQTNFGVGSAAAAASAVPEPASLWLAGVAVVFAIRMRR